MAPSGRSEDSFPQTSSQTTASKTAQLFLHLSQVEERLQYLAITVASAVARFHALHPPVQPKTGFMSRMTPGQWVKVWNGTFEMHRTRFQQTRQHLEEDVRGIVQDHVQEYADQEFEDRHRLMERSLEQLIVAVVRLVDFVEKKERSRRCR